jgi:signal transduction histidine kinase
LFTIQYAGATIAASLDLQRVLRALTGEMVNLLKAEGCLIMEWDETADTVRVMAEYSQPDGWSEALLLQSYNLTDYPIRRQVLLAGRPELMTTSTVNLDPDELSYMQANRLQTRLVLPMECPDRIIGLIEVVDRRVERIFNHEEIVLAQFLANQAAIAMENARLYEQAQQELAERKKTEDELRQTTTRIQDILAAIPDTLFYFNHHGELLDYKITADMSGTLSQPEVGENLDHMLPPEAVTSFRHYLDKALQTKTVQLFEYQLPSPFRTQTFEVRLVVTGADEVLAIVRDITEPKRVMEQTVRAERLAALGRMAAALAHEINNPLQAMQSHLELLLNYRLTDNEKQQALKVIYNQIDRLDQTTQQISHLADPKPAPQQQLSIADSIQQVLILFHKQLQEHAIQVTTDIRPVPPVLAVRDQLTHIFVNLIINAIEATPPDGQLNIAVYPEGDEVAASFTNTGPAITPEILPDGSGMGLWISHTMVEQHAGSLTVENLTNNQGVIFTVKLPAIRV